MIDLSDVCRNDSFEQWFPVLLIIHLANLRSVKIVQKSVKSQGIIQLLMSGNPDFGNSGFMQSLCPGNIWSSSCWDVGQDTKF